VDVDLEHGDGGRGVGEEDLQCDSMEDYGRKIFRRKKRAAHRLSHKEFT